MALTVSRCVVLLCSVSLVACSTVRTVVTRDATPAAVGFTLNRPLAPNDELVVTTLDGDKFALQVTTVSAAYIEGVTEGVTPSRRVDFDQVARIERREFDGGKTALLVVAIAAGIYVVVQAAASAAVASGGL